jgi:hypothetical protein
VSRVGNAPEKRVTHDREELEQQHFYVHPSKRRKP